MDMAEYTVLLSERLEKLKVAHSACEADHFSREAGARLFNSYQKAADSLFALIGDLVRHGRTIIIKRADGSEVEIKQPGYVYKVNISRAYWHSGTSYGGYEMTSALSVEVK